MQLSPEQQQHLSRLLQAELESGQQLLDVLEQENEALRGRDPDLITQISETKLEQLKAFEAQLSQRYRFLEGLGLGLGPDKAALDALLQPLGKSNPLTAQWQQLQKLADQLQVQNEINGGIVILSQRQVTMALDLLTGQSGSTSTYERSGKTTGDKTSTRFAKA